MPHFHIQTNVKNIPADFVKKAIPVVAKTLGKPAEYCVVSVSVVQMSFAGTDDPAAITKLMSIGQLGIEQNKKHSKVLCKLLQDELGISPDRVYIVFKDETAANVGYKGTTFHDILG